MRKIATLFAAWLLLLFPLYTFAQTTISGKIVNQNDGTPVSGATVLVKGKGIGTKTDANGNFTINASPGDVLVISSVNFSPQNVKVKPGGNITVQLALADATMGEVVVTALDIKRNSREVGSGIQTVAGKEIAESGRENFINGLQGRVAGATVTSTSGNPGASSSIVLRGFNSLSLSNQPLFVIDGVVVDNTTIDENSNGGSGVGLVERGAGLTNTSNRNTDYNNRMADLNPNDIESVTILKGPEAAALYGSQAGSGAIIITTKRAKSPKLAVQYDNSFRITKLTRFPETFDGYQSGTNGDTLSVFRYYGPAYKPGTQLFDNKSKFFKTGFSQTHNLGVDFGFKKSELQSLFRFSASYFNQDGIVPSNDYSRYTVKLSNTTKLGKWGDISPAVSFTHTATDKVLRSAGGYMLALLSWPSTNDITATQGDNASKVPLFNANSNLDFDNPLFSVKRNKNREETDRYNLTLGVNFTPLSWLTIAGRFGYEKYETDGYLRYHPLSYYVTAGQGGIQDDWWRKYHGYNHTITVTGKKTLGKNYNFRLMAGTMWQDYETQMYAITGTNIVDSVVNGKMYKGGVVLDAAAYDALPGPSDSNATRVNTRTKLLRNVYGEYNQSILREFAYFGEFAFNYKNKVFVNYTHRFEEASTLPKSNRKFNYPAGSVSFIMTDIFKSWKKVFNYMKLRGSLASTAKLNTPYSTQSVFVNNLSSGGGFSYGFFNNNADLHPEKQTTYEIGGEMRFFRSRLSIDATYYNALCKGQIIENFRLSYGTGFVLNTQNAGSTRNQGVEVTIDAAIMKKRSFGWNMRVNFAKGWNKVVELPKNVSLYYLADVNLYGNAAGGIVLGGSTTAISGFGYLRNTRGDKLISPTTGLPVIDGNQRVRGDRNPNFNVGLLNNFRYKNWKLNMLWDIKAGGDIFNGNNQYLTTIGRSKLTADRMVPRVIEGVLQDGLENTATPTRNTIAVTPYYNDLYYRSLPEEEFIEKDVNWLRLKEITLEYMFPPKFVKRVKWMKTLSAFATANDVFLFTNYTGADPSVNGNTAGTRGVGAFGFDYGTLPSQLSLNFGLRASF